MTLSLRTLAIIEAAAIEGTMSSPPITHLWYILRSGMSVLPSTRTMSGSVLRRSTDLFMHQRDARRMLILSILAGEAACALHITPLSQIISKRVSLFGGESFFESFSPFERRYFLCSAVSITAAATTGPGRHTAPVLQAAMHNPGTALAAVPASDHAATSATDTATKGSAAADRPATATR